METRKTVLAGMFAEYWKYHNSQEEYMRIKGIGPEQMRLVLAVGQREFSREMDRIKG